MVKIPRRATLAVGALASVALLLVALLPSGCVTPKPPQRTARFVGNAACEPCHRAEFGKHSRSRHARSLHTATVADLGPMAPPEGPVGTSGVSVRRDGDKLYLNTPSSKKEILLGLALGSGKSGITFIGINDDGTVTEGRMSYFPNKNVWYITPGHEYGDLEAPGYKHDVATSRQCVTCHTISIPEKRLDVERKFFGIGCETCHGPGSAHIEAAKNKESDLLMAKMNSWNATQVNEACGKCHRSPAGVGTSGTEITMTNRFQAFGLMQSPCFEKTNNTLSCISCHDPHDNAWTNPKDYEAVCLNCHAPKSKTACPVNPTSKCISCHMPSRKVFPKSDVPIAMADHLIWANGKKNHTSATP